MSDFERIELWERVGHAVGRKGGESLLDAARRALKRKPDSQRGRVARAVLFGPRDPWARLERADLIAKSGGLL